MLLSATAFNGIWKYSFEQTTTERFYNYKADRIFGNVNMMSINGNFGYANIFQIGAEFVELPYADVDTSMILVLPKIGKEIFTTIDGINQFNFERVLMEVDASKERNPKQIINVRLPSFEMQSDLNLVEPLENVSFTVFFINLNLFFFPP
jgi:serine protease inhibitor